MLTKQHFYDWVRGVKQRPAAARQELQRAPRYQYSPSRLIEIRGRTSLSQAQFAQLLNVSVKTLQNWEQGRRRPAGPAVSLIRIVDREPAIALRALRVAFTRPEK